MPACVTQHVSFANSKHVDNNRVAPARRTWQHEPLEEEVEADRLLVDVGEVVLCVAHRDRRFPHGAITQDDHLRIDRQIETRNQGTSAEWLHMERGCMRASVSRTLYCSCWGSCSLSVSFDMALAAQRRLVCFNSGVCLLEQAHRKNAKFNLSSITFMTASKLNILTP